ncbi:uncharacterized protein LOC111614486 [Centruroides sculpturatus]|nr:uncharacterized protein LOC111614486 [Centruroides sculpturatus]
MALHTLKKNRNITMLGSEMIKEAQKVANNRTIKFNWIPAHRGKEGNETADLLAKKACHHNTNITYKRLPNSALNHHLRQWEIEKWQSEWNQSSTGRHCFSYIPYIKDRLKNKHFRIRHETTQVLTNHGKFSAYLHRIKKTDNGKCHCDGVSEGDANHYIYDCNIYDQFRYPLYRECITQGVGWRPQANEIFNRKEIWEQLENFVRKTKALLPDYHYNMETQGTNSDLNNDTPEESDSQRSEIFSSDSEDSDYDLY